MKVAVFGGSFDPVHIEHIRLAKAAIDELGLDKLFVMPAHTPPHKKGKTLTADADRLEMCRLAFQGIEKIEVSDYEIAQGGTSYTYLTCRYFRSLYSSADDELFWIVGTDMLRDFPTWKHPEDILQNATLAVCGRAETIEKWDDAEQESFRLRFGKPFRKFAYNGAAVSSTKLRVLAGAGMALSEYTDEKTAAYIQEKGLYKIENADKALALEKEERRAHSLRVAELAAAKAVKLGISERQAIAAALFHDCAKNLGRDSECLKGFEPPMEWGEIPKEVFHQFAGAFVAEHIFGVTDTDVLNAIRYHTSARENMSTLEKLVFLADMLEPQRRYQGVDELRELFYTRALDECLTEALRQTLLFLKEKGGEIYSLTERAYAYYAQKNK